MTTHNFIKLLTEELDLWATRVYKVIKPVRAYAYGKSAPSNEFMGRLRVQRAPAFKITLHPGDKIVYASAFYGVVGGKVMKVTFSPPKLSSFEKSYGRMDDLVLRRMIDNGLIQPTDEQLSDQFKVNAYSPNEGEYPSHEGSNTWT